MMLVSPVLRWLILVVCGLICGGCWEDSNSPLNEQKEAYFLKGRSLETSLDWPGAVEAFEKALEVNPRNASAHFELFTISEERLADYAAAIYHGERFLKLRPKSEFADVVRQHITRCKVELAKNLPVGPVSPPLQRDLERLSAENKLLRQQLDQMAQRLALATNRAIQPPPTLLTQTVATQAVVAFTNSNTRTSPPPVLAARGPSLSAGVKTHSVKQHETLVKIAREYHVALPALLNANPGVDPKRLKPGQTLKIPST